MSPGREKRAGTDSDRDSELELDYAQCKFISLQRGVKQGLCRGLS